MHHRTDSLKSAASEALRAMGIRTRPSSRNIDALGQSNERVRSLKSGSMLANLNDQPNEMTN